MERRIATLQLERAGRDFDVTLVSGDAQVWKDWTQMLWERGHPGEMMPDLTYQFLPRRED